MGASRRFLGAGISPHCDVVAPVSPKGTGKVKGLGQATEAEEEEKHMSITTEGGGDVPKKMSRLGKRLQDTERVRKRLRSSLVNSFWIESLY